MGNFEHNEHINEEKGCGEHARIHKGLVVHVQEAMPDNEEIYDLADFFKIFSDSTRVKILCALRQGAISVCCIADILGVSQSAISHQLRTLKQMKLVEAKREGKTVFYSLADSHIESILDQGFEHIRE